jgi:hypothetical protein
MSTPQTIESLQQRIAALEAELARVRPFEAAAREAHAFFTGRRPGFPATYARDVILAVFETGASLAGNTRPKPSRAAKRRRQG